MAQGLRVPAVLAEDLGPFPSDHMMTHGAHNPNSRGSNAIFWLPWAPTRYTPGAHTYDVDKTLAYMKYIKRRC